MSARGDLRAAIEGGGPVFAPVCLDPLTARTIEALGYGAAYLSGGGLGFQLAVSEALLTTTEVATAARQITQRSSVPLIVDGGVGFGDALHASRAIRRVRGGGRGRGRAGGSGRAQAGAPPQGGRASDPGGRRWWASWRRRWRRGRTPTC